jgi:thioredoxin-like negative regulator of GroEL
MILLLAPLIAIAVIGGAALLLKGQKGAQRELVGTVLEGTHGNMPSVLYFTGEACTICHTAQRPALRALAPTLDPGIEIREIDIAVEPELARRYRVMSLPTIIVLDAAGEITDINVGFTTGEVLRRQLVEAGMPVAA